MQPVQRSPAQLHLALVAVCLLLAAYLPAWQKLWFVAESGHYGGGTVWVWLLGLYRRWRPAQALTYGYALLLLVVVGYILLYNSASDDPTLGFALISSLHLAGVLVLHYSSAIQHYLGGGLLPTLL